MNNARANVTGLIETGTFTFGTGISSFEKNNLGAAPA